MSSAGGKPGTGNPQQMRLGFLETLEIDGRGHIGGLLITNQNGRPLEFQCTTPVRPNRTQEILFGETLKPWLLGELIGSTLIDRVSIKPDLIITSDPILLELRNHTSIPVAQAESPGSEARSGSGRDDDRRSCRIGGRLLRFHEAHAEDAAALDQRRHLIPDSADLAEPLERVREALSETVRTVFPR